jgi:hypothetical protein
MVALSRAASSSTASDIAHRAADGAVGRTCLYRDEREALEAAGLRE